jgi:ubiquinone/menaquinone biosynthesis C-methylase UbiE
MRESDARARPYNVAMEERYYLELAAAFVRGRLGGRAGSDEEELQRGLEAGLKLHKFKRSSELPRVRKVLGMLRGLAPESLLDVGSGRGVFLWPLLDGLPELRVCGIDRDQVRARDLGAVRRGGVTRLSAARMDARRLAFADGTFDGVSLLEVLEHMEAPGQAAQQALRVARRFVIASVPTHEDDNPEHINLFDESTLGALFPHARRITFDHVLNHTLCVVHK